jgi:hypothetical protein
MPTGGIAMLARAVDLAREHHLPYEILRPLGNITSFNNGRDLAAAEAAAREGLAVIEQMGVRDRYGSILCNFDIGLWYSGGWDELVSTSQPSDFIDLQSALLVQVLVSMVGTARGSFADNTGLNVTDEFSDDPYVRVSFDMLRALKLASLDRYADAAELAAAAVDSSVEASGIDDDYVLYWPFAVEYSLAAGQVDPARDLLNLVAGSPPGLVTPLVHAQYARLRGMTAAAEGDLAHADEDLTQAAEELRAFGAPYYLARTLLSLAHVRQDSAAPVTHLLDEARAIFESLGARPWVVAVDKLAASVTA